MPRVIHFEIHAGNPERAISFYEKLFAWTFQKWEGPMPYWLVTTGPDVEPVLTAACCSGTARSTARRCIAYVCTTGVEDVDASIATAEGKRRHDRLVPKMPVPGVGWLVYCKDTEGNIFGMMQPDTNAG